MDLSNDDTHNDDNVQEAIVLGQDLITTILSRAPFETVKPKVDAGAPLWFQDDEGTSALHAAAYVGSPQIVQYLLEQGAVWNAGTYVLLGLHKLC